ncbi:SAM-dependent methyltransferase [Amycolatopsis magusensis]|uniref:SAM-dependent methyltransferase n=1 Tax=Amycolatopsis magusensis TaxID=882444 RepID=A0ABS4PMU4_9PSEU|nr:SAM-dependent methyltransferase [Amycolatopsis magusensis]MBP2179951.1 SAM-dependent methyltransferase [Amycolatopsis magusensis]MDI5979840.1 SAM-dependent methyltransferase [Amycolatopsis magusensis]
MPAGTAASPERAPVGVDPTRASIARVYDAFLNGKDNYEIDREVLRGVQQKAPEAQDLATENRGFLIRACRFLASQTGITQYLDLGSGLPTAENTHQVVQRLVPESTVVYVDNDPVVLAHGRALLEENDRTHLISADIFHPHEVLEHAEVRTNLDFSQPMALLQAGTLHHHVGDPAEPARIMREYVDALAPGSYVAISHFLDPENEHSPIARKMEDVFVHSPMGSGTFRTHKELLELFGDLELVEPGLTRCADWWPDGPRIRPLNQVQHCIAGAVGRKR